MNISTEHTKKNITVFFLKVHRIDLEINHQEDKGKMG
jgi:hypothetical protein